MLFTFKGVLHEETQCEWFIKYRFCSPCGPVPMSSIVQSVCGKEGGGGGFYGILVFFSSTFSWGKGGGGGVFNDILLFFPSTFTIRVAI